MPAFDIQAQVTGWVLDEAAKQSFTDQIGVAVTFTRSIAVMPNGAQQWVIQWTILLTIPSGLVGRGPVTNSFVLDASLPAEAPVRQAVAAAIEQMRKLRNQVRAVSNGHSKPRG